MLPSAHHGDEALVDYVIDGVIGPFRAGAEQAFGLRQSVVDNIILKREIAAHEDPLELIGTLEHRAVLQPEPALNDFQSRRLVLVERCMASFIASTNLRAAYGPWSKSPPWRSKQVAGTAADSHPLNQQRNPCCWACTSRADRKSPASTRRF